MPRTLAVAGVQMSARPGAVAENVEKALHWLDQAGRAGAKVICLPEMFNTGYFSHTSHADPSYFDLAEGWDGPTLTAVRERARRWQAVVVAPIVERGGPGIQYNAAAVVDCDGTILGTYKKIHVPWSFTGWEKFYFRPGYELPVFHTRYVRLGVQICYDRDFPEGARCLALDGAEVLFYPTGCPRTLTEMWELILRARAYENQVFVVGVGLTGRADEEHHEFAGHSLVVDPRGRVMASLDREEGLVLAEIDLDQVAEARKMRFFHRDRRPETYSRITRLI